MSKEQGEYEAQAMPFFFGAAIAVAVMWGWYALEHFTNLRITGLFGTANEDAMPIYVALATTAIAPIVAAVFWRRAVGIVKNGVPGLGTVLSVGVKVQDLRDVEFEFEFEGVTYTNKTSMYVETADKLQPGDEIEIIIDKRKPTRVLVK
jgi:hypothetical protein